MTKMCDEVLAANEAYAKNFGGKAKLPMPPARRFAILTCMDARLDPTKFAGLSEGDAHVIRNAGGRASGSLVISPQVARHQGVVRYPPHRLRHGDLHRRLHLRLMADSAQTQISTSVLPKQSGGQRLLRVNVG
jgi:hypothetical protein